MVRNAGVFLWPERPKQTSLANRGIVFGMAPKSAANGSFFPFCSKNSGTGDVAGCFSK
jgi:hypothetical protein